jgi:rhamnulokinase
VRCILDSLALAYRRTIREAAALSGRHVEVVHLVGGGARNALLCRWTAGATGLPVLAGPEEATLVGNLVVQAIALGELGSLQEAREVVRGSFRPVLHEPRETSAWDEADERFRRIVAGSYEARGVAA